MLKLIETIRALAVAGKSLRYVAGLFDMIYCDNKV